MDMASTEELGLVWMGDMLLHNDPGGLMLNSALDPHRHGFFADTQQALDDVRHATPMYVQDMNGFVMLDELEDPYYEETEDDEEKKPMSTAGTQTNPNFGVTRKIKPVKHPALKLQTPIAYQRDTDLNVIPIQRDGMAVCEKCGAIGVKHAFYTRERRFCSLACARGSTDQPNPLDPLADSPHSQPSESEMEPDRMRSHHNVAPVPKPPPPIPEDEPPLFPPDRKSQSHLHGTYEWLDMLAEQGFSAAPVSAFYHAPMSNCWDNITVGMKVEVENTDCDNYSEGVPDSFWVATVLKVAGYKALLRYEGFGQNESKDFWVNLCSSKVHPVGWCATRGKPLIPPKTIEDKYKDWKHFLVKRLTGARTLPSNFYSKVHENLKSRFRCDLNLEVVDKNRISQVKVATIKKIVGKRLHVRYYDADPTDNGFWAHEDSPLIHPVGWAKRVGQTLAAPPTYVDRCLKGLRDKDDATEDLFPLHNSMGYHTGFKRNMKLEAVDPLNLSSVCVATIMKVLNEGYLMIRIDSYDEDASSPGSDWFCYHASSACLMPPGFCDMHSLRLTPPKGYDPATFHWPDYLSETGAIPAPPNLFDIECPEHSFVVGQRLEAADLMDPRLVCVATVSQIVGRLIKVHFDGWEEEYDQWLDCSSPDMYPVGWCELVSHKLEGPNAATVLKPNLQQKIKPHTEGRTTKRRKGGRRGVGRGGGKIRNGDAESTSSSNTTGTSESPVPPQMAACTPSLSLNSQPTKPSGEMVTSVGYDDDGAIEMGEEPTGPDQSLPDELPVQTLNNLSAKDDTQEIEEEDSVTDEKEELNNVSKVIPRLIGGMTGSFLELSRVTPEEWDESDVAMFLKINDCAAYCDSFTSRKINGKMLLELTKDEIIDLTGMKVGPSVKIHDLIQQLKIKVNPAQERMKAGFKKLY